MGNFPCTVVITLADCSGYSLEPLPMKNLIRGEDSVGCSVRGTACLGCLYAWKERLVYMLTIAIFLSGMRSWTICMAGTE